MGIAVEVLERFELDECDRADVSVLKEMLGTDMRTPGDPPFAFSDKALVDLRQEARRGLAASLSVEHRGRRPA
jgi:hypothetical protein